MKNKNTIYVKSFSQYKELWDWTSKHSSKYLSCFTVSMDEAMHYIISRKRELAQAEANEYRNAWEEIAMDEQGPTIEHATKHLMEKYGWSKEVAETTAVRMYNNTLKSVSNLFDKQEVGVFYAAPELIEKLLKDLKWHCPVAFVRDWMRYSHGIKTKWYHKIFFKK